LTTWVFPHIGQLPVASIDTTLVMKVLQQRVGTGEDAPTFCNSRTETASRVRGRIEAILGWAKAQKLRDGDNPASWTGNLKHLLPARAQVAPVEHHPALPYRDLPAFMKKLRAIDTVIARALEWTILTAARTGDTIGAKWSEISTSERVWTVPAGRLKAKKGTRRKDHAIPLSDRALAILAGLPREDDVVFPGSGAGKGLGETALSVLLDEMVSCVATVHGMRSSFKDWASEQTAYPNEMSELALAHTVSDKVEAAYRRGDMRDKRRRMMEDWSAFCASPPAATDNVVALRAGL
jgi:integrase